VSEEIKWHRYEEFPKEGSVVAILTGHNKNHVPISFQIEFGEVDHYINREGEPTWCADTNDLSGGGSYYPGQNDVMIACVFNDLSPFFNILLYESVISLACLAISLAFSVLF